MSGRYILKNVFNFAQILNLASTEHLRKWDESMLQKALSWATYCEEVHKHVNQQGCDDSLNAKLHQLTVLMSPASLLRLNFDSLMRAREFVTETILTNPHGTPNLQKSLEIQVGTVVWHKITNKIKDRPVFHDDLDGMFSLYWIQNETSHKNLKKDCSESVYAQIFLTNLVSILETNENQKRFQHYCQALCDQLVAVRRGWEVLVHVFLASAENHSSEDQTRKEEILRIVLSWMDSKYQDINYIMKCPILEVDRNLLERASLSTDGFLMFYLSSLEKWSKCFQPCLVEGVCKELWKDADGNGASLLTEHFRSLLMILSGSKDSKADSKSAVLKLLCENIKNSDFTVWRIVGKSLLGT